MTGIVFVGDGIEGKDAGFDPYRRNPDALSSRRRPGSIWPMGTGLRRCDEGVGRGIFIGGGDDQRGLALEPIGRQGTCFTSVSAI
jgi:hypothetical protein